MELLAEKCGRIDTGLKTGALTDITHLLEEMPTNSETFELVARFCQGYELNLTAENVVPLSCLAHFLDMTESHCRNNLLRKALAFFEHKVLPSWNDTVKAFRTTESVLYEAGEIGILGACVESLISKALSDPHLLGDPTKKRLRFDESESEDDAFSRPSTRRKLFVLNWKSEDLTTLSLRLYEPLMHEMVKRGVPSAHVAVSLCDYARKWVFGSEDEKASSVYKRNSQREIVEAVERLLPDERGVVPYSALFEMLRCANVLEASSGCKDGLEMKIGRDLNNATVKDLLILSRGRGDYDMECVRRILKHFYGNYTSGDISGLVTVAELVEEFLAEAASDSDMKKEAFGELAKMSTEVSRGTQRSSDGIYKGIDVYLDKHRHLTESEREEVCQVLDVHKMSHEACDHAAKNERLPLRVVLQVLFVVQMELRETIGREVQSSQAAEDVEEEEEEARLLGGGGEERVGAEMKKMSRKIVELERECGAMRRKMESNGGGGGGRSVVKKAKAKASLWKEMKRKFGCIGSTSSSVTICNNCQLKRKKRDY